MPFPSQTTNFNHYHFLTRSLSPHPGDEFIQDFRDAATSSMFDFNLVLFHACANFCTPLWFARLRQHGLLSDLPLDLREFLYLLHQANVERMTSFRQALLELLQFLQTHKIQAIFLKGAATFFDDIYQDPGARMMGDIDLLVKMEDVSRVHEYLSQSGYLPMECHSRSNYSPDYQSQHLPRLLKPNSPVVFEIHWNIARGHAGRVLPTALAWNNTQIVTLGDAESYVLNPTARILHNTIHALLPQKEFIRSEISLLQLAEFTALANRYQNEIDWAYWFDIGRSHGLGREFSAYIHLANQLVGMPLPSSVIRYKSVSFDLWRLTSAARYITSMSNAKKSLVDTLIASSVLSVLRGYYLATVPGWLWRNIAYDERSNLFSTRMHYMKKYFKASLRNKLFRTRDAHSSEV